MSEIPTFFIRHADAVHRVIERSLFAFPTEPKMRKF